MNKKDIKFFGELALMVVGIYALLPALCLIKAFAEIIYKLFPALNKYS